MTSTLPRTKQWTAKGFPAVGVAVAMLVSLISFGAASGIAGAASSSPPSVTFNGSAANSYVFWKGTNGNLWERVGPPGEKGPIDQGMGILGSAPSVVYDQEYGEDLVFWKGTDSNLWMATCTGTTCVGPTEVPGMGPLGSQPTAVVPPFGGYVEVFWRGAYRGLWSADDLFWTWTGPTEIGNMGFLGSAPTAVISGDDGIWGPYVQAIYWEGMDGNLWETYQVYNCVDGCYWHPWVGPINQGMGPLGSQPSAVIGSNGDAYVYWQGSGNGNLWQAIGNPTGALSGPYDLGMGVLGSAPSVAENYAGDDFVYWAGTDDNLWVGYWNGYTWVGPQNDGMGNL